MSAKNLMNARPGQRRKGFTLPELMMAATLSVVVVGGALSTSLMITRSGINISQYEDMESESRRTLEQFGQDVRMAKRIVWHNANSITLTIPTDNSGSPTAIANFTYTYDAAAKTFSRTSTAGTTVLLSGIEECTLMGFQLNGQPTHTSASPDWTIVANSTKQLQLSISSRRSQSSQVNSTQKVISARFILRNKRVAA